MADGGRKGDAVIVGIVGAEERKFTSIGRSLACQLISELLSVPDVTEVVSGACHLGGIDIWAAEIGHALGLVVTEYPPLTLSWQTGYRPRNLRIVARSDVVHCITVSRLPRSFHGMTFPLCYHCGTNDHVKSGGCWTAKVATKIKGKSGVWHIIRQ